MVTSVADEKSLSPEEALAILSDMKIDIPVPKAAVTQRNRNVALDMAISALSCSEIPNSSDTISRQAAIDAIMGEPTDAHYPSWYAERLEQLPSAHPSADWIERTVSDDAVIKEWQSAKCSACGRYHTTPYMYYFDNYNYCPHCGARMRGDHHE